MLTALFNVDRIDANGKCTDVTKMAIILTMDTVEGGFVAENTSAS
jgi:hypothetical protein